MPNNDAIYRIKCVSRPEPFGGPPHQAKKLALNEFLNSFYT